MKRSKKPSEPTPAPASWAALLEDAVNTPGMIASAFSAFHNYSVGNQYLAYRQCKARGIEVGPISTFKNWLNLGRPVRKGERAIVLCQPRTWSKDVEDDKTGETKKVGGVTFTYRPSWFVLAQTDGPDVEMPSLPEWDSETALGALGLERVPFAHTDGNTLGYSQGGKIAINPVAPHPMAVLAHELGHELLHQGEENQHGKELPRTLKEMEAEAVALIVLDSLGLPGGEECRGYIQHWYGSGQAIPDKNAQRIFGAATRILKAGRPADGVASEVEVEPVVIVQASSNVPHTPDPYENCTCELCEEPAE